MADKNTKDRIFGDISKDIDMDSEESHALPENRDINNDSTDIKKNKHTSRDQIINADNRRKRRKITDNVVSKNDSKDIQSDKKRDRKLRRKEKFLEDDDIMNSYIMSDSIQENHSKNHLIIEEKVQPTQEVSQQDIDTYSDHEDTDIESDIDIYEEQYYESDQNAEVNKEGQLDSSNLNISKEQNNYSDLYDEEMEEEHDSEMDIDTIYKYEDDTKAAHEVSQKDIEMSVDNKSMSVDDEVEFFVNQDDNIIDKHSKKLTRQSSNIPDVQMLDIDQFNNLNDLAKDFDNLTLSDDKSSNVYSSQRNDTDSMFVKDDDIKKSTLDKAELNESITEMDSADIDSFDEEGEYQNYFDANIKQAVVESDQNAEVNKEGQLESSNLNISKEQNNHSELYDEEMEEEHDSEMDIDTIYKYEDNTKTAQEVSQKDIEMSEEPYYESKKNNELNKEAQLNSENLNISKEQNSDLYDEEMQEEQDSEMSVDNKSMSIDDEVEFSLNQDANIIAKDSKKLSRQSLNIPDVQMLDIDQFNNLNDLAKDFDNLKLSDDKSANVYSSQINDVDSMFVKDNDIKKSTLDKAELNESSVEVDSSDIDSVDEEGEYKNYFDENIEPEVVERAQSNEMPKDETVESANLNVSKEQNNHVELYDKDSEIEEENDLEISVKNNPTNNKIENDEQENIEESNQTVYFPEPNIDFFKTNRTLLNNSGFLNDFFSKQKKSEENFVHDDKEFNIRDLKNSLHNKNENENVTSQQMNKSESIETILDDNEFNIQSDDKIKNLTSTSLYNKDFNSDRHKNREDRSLYNMPSFDHFVQHNNRLKKDTNPNFIDMPDVYSKKLSWWSRLIHRVKDFLYKVFSKKRVDDDQLVNSYIPNKEKPKLENTMKQSFIQHVPNKKHNILKEKKL